MRFLVITQYFYPETFRINDIVAELVRRNHSVTVLTGLPNYPEGKVYDGYENSYKKVSFFKGALVHRCDIRPRKKGLFNLLLNYLSFVIKAKRKLKTIKPDFDVVYFYEPSPISSGIPAVWYGKKHHIPTVIYNLDIWPDCVRDLANGKTMSKRNPIFIVAKIVSRKVYSHFDLILNKCEEFGQYLTKELRISKAKMITLFEHAENVYLSVPEKNNCANPVVFMFLGNIGLAQNCEQILEAFQYIEKSKFQIHFVGDGSNLNHLKRYCSYLKMDCCVFFHDRCSVEETIDYYNMADVCLLTLSNNTAAGMTPPSKLMGYMAAGKPILASSDGASRAIIEESKCGLVCKPGDIKAFTEMAEKLINNREELTQMGKRGRWFFRTHFTLDSHISSLLLILNGLVYSNDT